MIKIINYTLAITIISIFTLLSTNNVFAANNSKKCVCSAVKTIKNQKYLCKISKDGKCICKKAPTGNTVKKSTPHKNNVVKNNQQKKAVAKKTTKQQVKKTQNKKNSTPAKKSAPVKKEAKKVNPTTTPVAPIKAIDPVVKTSTNPLIVVNRFEEDPTFLASVTGILYRTNQGIKIIDVATVDESKDLIVQAYKLLKTSSMWGKNAVFISGSNKAKIEPIIIVVKSKNDQFFVTQNSGVLTFIQDTVGISEARVLQRVNFKSETLNGRDVEYLIGAKLIDNPDNFNKMGEKIDLAQLTKFNYTPLQSSQNDLASLFIVEDKNNGNIFTFIPSEQFNKFNPQDNDIFKITLSNGQNILLQEEAIYKNSRTYRGGDEAIILDYKSSIGTYIAIKNIQNNGLSTLPSNGKSYKIEITPVAKGKPVDISNIENTDSAEAENIPLDEETSTYVPYSTQREKTEDITIEDSVQNPKEADIKNLQKEKKSVDSEITPKEEKSLTDNETKSIYPGAGRNNLAPIVETKPEVDISKEDISEEEEIIEDSANEDDEYKDNLFDNAVKYFSKDKSNPSTTNSAKTAPSTLNKDVSTTSEDTDREIEELDREIQELENQKDTLEDDENTLDSMIDEDLENEVMPASDEEGIKGISSTNSYIDEEDGVLISKLAANDPSKQIDDELATQKAIRSNDQMNDTLTNQNIRDAKRDSKQISNIEEDFNNTEPGSASGPPPKKTKY